MTKSARKTRIKVAMDMATYAALARMAKQERTTPARLMARFLADSMKTAR